jgi:predicted amidohydrolase YtcJ
MALANKLALAAAKVTRTTPEVEGGTIVRDTEGEPTGILKDNAQSYVNRVEPPNTPEQDDRALAAAMAHVAEKGVTSVHNMGDFSGLAAIERAHAGKSMITRVYQVLPIAQWQRVRDTVAARGRGDEWFESVDSRASSMDRSDRTRQRCSRLSPTLQRIPAFSLKPRMIYIDGRPKVTKPGFR